MHAIKKIKLFFKSCEPCVTISLVKAEIGFRRIEESSFHCKEDQKKKDEQQNLVDEDLLVILQLDDLDFGVVVDKIF